MLNILHFSEIFAILRADLKNERIMKLISSVLAIAATAIAMVSCCGQPDLNGKWNILKVNGEEVAVIGDEKPFIEFNTDESKVHGFTGCNIVNGNFSVQPGNKIKFDNVITTMKFCDGISDERSVLNGLNEADNFTVYRQDDLYYLDIKNAAGETVLHMKRHNADVLISCRDTLEGFDISPEIFACEGGLTRRQVKEAVAKAAEQSGFTDTHKHWKFDASAVKTMIMNFITKPDFVSYCCYNLPYHRAKKKENRAVLGWTIQSEAQAEKLRPWVDNVIFENFRPRKTAE